VPIGRPIANTQIFLLDSSLQPVPVGVTGELYIGGVGLARGYLHQPDLTQEKFIRSPFSSDSSLRLYRTGDLARYLPDGKIVFVGRIDTQVKIRGYRIELGEIESVLSQHPAVREAVVLAREDNPGDRRLVTYVVTVPGSPSANELRSFLQQKFPEYMVPSVFMFLDALPLTPNGKVDRKALPAPDPIRPESDETFAAPRTPVEEVLVNIWAEVLKIDKLGIHDNFFELGGHSLLAIQAVSRVRDALRKTIPLRNLFEAPTVSALALLIEKSNQSQEAVHAPAIVRASRESYRVKLEK
jgi:acyl carrier protein